MRDEHGLFHTSRVVPLRIHGNAVAPAGGAFLRQSSSPAASCAGFCEREPK